VPADSFLAKEGQGGGCSGLDLVSRLQIKARSSQLSLCFFDRSINHFRPAIRYLIDSN